MLFIFDVDGTLVGGETTDWRCFTAAFQQVLGFTARDAFWSGITEVTAKAIVHAALPDHSPADRLPLETAIARQFLQNLQAAHALDPTCFPPLPGTLELWAHLRAQSGIAVAIATGDWQDSITLKLAAAGFDLAGIPLATSTDCQRRADIIRLAAQRAGRDLTEAIYVGDGLWDLRACRELGIPFLGVGRRQPEFLTAGATHLLASLELALFSPWFARFQLDRHNATLSCQADAAPAARKKGQLI